MNPVRTFHTSTLKGLNGAIGMIIFLKIKSIKEKGLTG